MIVEILPLVRTMGENYIFFYLILICNYIELAPGCSVPVETNAMPDSVVSDQELSERSGRQVAALDGEALDEDTNLELYITGKTISQLWSSILIMLTSDLRLEYATESSDFSLLDSVKLVIFNLGLTMRRERLCCWRGSRKTHGSSHRSLNCKNLWYINTAWKI